MPKTYGASLRPDELLALSRAEVWAVFWSVGRGHRHITRHTTLEAARAALAALPLEGSRIPAIYAESYIGGERGVFVPDDYPAAYPGAVPGVGDGSRLAGVVSCNAHLPALPQGLAYGPGAKG